MRDKKPYPITVYWLDGKREILWAESATYDGSDLTSGDLAAAFNKAGYGGGATRAVDWYAKTATNSHWWDATNRKWVKRENVKMAKDDVLALTDTQLALVLDRDTLTIELPNKDQVVIEPRKYSAVMVGRQVEWVGYGDLVAAEYCEGPYHDGDQDDHHFMVCFSRQFPAGDLSNLVKAVRQFFDEATTSNDYAGACSIDQLFEAQDGLK